MRCCYGMNQCTFTSTRLWYQAAVFCGEFPKSKALVDYPSSATALYRECASSTCQRLNRRFLIVAKLDCHQQTTRETSGLLAILHWVRSNVG